MAGKKSDHDSARATPAGMKIEPKNEHGMTAVVADGHMYPFTFDRAQILRIYTTQMKQVQFDFTPVKLEGKTLALDAQEQESLRRRVTLHWMYFYAMNHLPILIKPGDLDHPQTYDIVRDVVGEKFGAGTDAAFAVGGKLLGMSSDAFRGYIQRYDDLMDRF